MSPARPCLRGSLGGCQRHPKIIGIGTQLIPELQTRLEREIVKPIRLLNGSPVFKLAGDSEPWFESPDLHAQYSDATVEY
jgi:hypothetical protein